MSYKRYFGLLIAAVVTISMFRPQNVEASEKVLTSSRETLMVGKSISLKVNGIKSSKVKWKSSKTSVATVNKSGVVKEKKAGSATITGKYSGITFKTTIKVTAKLGKNEIYNSNGIKISYAGTTSYYEKNFVRLKIKSSTGKELSFILKYLLLDKKYVDGGGATFKVPSNFTSELELTGM